VNVPALVIGFVVIGVHYSTYMSESYRAGIDCCAPRSTRSCDGPVAAARAEVHGGHPAAGAARDHSVIWATTPSRCSRTHRSCSRSTSSSSSLSAKEFGADRTFAYTEAFTLAGIIFLAASYPTSLLIQRLEKRLASY
jgi:polar amino acid transport system permease protein